MGNPPARASEVRTVSFEPGPRKDLDALYNRWNAGLTGTAVRPTYPCCPPDLGGNKREGHLWPPRGKAEGYVIVMRQGTTLAVTDWAGPAEQVLRVLKSLADHAHATEIRFGVAPHYDSDLARQLRRLNCRVETNHMRCGGAMVRTINLASTLAKIAPELARRLKASSLADWRGRLAIQDAREGVTLTIDAAKVAVGPNAATRHAIRGGDAMAQLLLGTDEPGEVVEAGGIKLSGDARELVKVLFPSQHPMLGAWDRF